MSTTTIPARPGDRALIAYVMALLDIECDGTEDGYYIEDGGYFVHVDVTGWPVVAWTVFADAEGGDDVRAYRWALPVLTRCPDLLREHVGILLEDGAIYDHDMDERFVSVDEWTAELVKFSKRRADARRKILNEVTK